MNDEKELREELGDIYQKIDDLKIPVNTYAGIEIDHELFRVTEIGAGKTDVYDQASSVEEADRQIVSWLHNQAKNNNYKFVAAGVTGKNNLHKLASMLWLEEDIVPYVLEGEKGNHESGEKIARQVEKLFDKQNICDIVFADRNEVKVAELVTLEDYKKTCSAEDFVALEKLAGDFKGKKLVFFSATPRGGGVALMRHALIRLYRLLGVDAHWYVMSERAEVFDVTKRKFHNVLQAVAPEGVELTEKDKEIYNDWTAENVENFKDIFKSADVVVIDDPQPSGMLPKVREINPKAKIIYRSHIQIESKLAGQEGTPQNKTWKFIWNNIKSADCFISHPISNFIPAEVPIEKTVMMPATTDPLDGLNKPLSGEQMEYYLKLFDKILVEANQSPLDHSRDYIVQIARFDPSKGIPDVIESYGKLRERLASENKPVPQLVICGHGSVDDPDGAPIYNLTMEILSKEPYKNFANDVKVARLPHVDQLLNAILRGAKVALQLSHKEGFEIKVTESLMKGVPVIAYQCGGIPLQIIDNQGGYIIPEIGNTSGVADKLYDLFTDQKEYERMSKAASDNARRDVLTVPNAVNWLFLATQLLRRSEINSNSADIRNLIKERLMVNKAVATPEA